MEEYEERVNKSNTNPIFALMYANWCPMCHGMPEKFLKFYESYKDKTNVTFTLIECTDRLWCLHQGARSIPYWVIIRGTIPEYWEYTNKGDPTEWKKLVDQASAGAAVRLYSNDFDNRIYDTIKGSSYFHLVIQEDHKEIFKRFTELADEYLSYGCKFTYKIKSMTKPSLRVYRSPFCMYKIKGDIGNFDWFIESNKYSHIHKYNENDIKEVNKTRPFALYVIESMMQQRQFNNFINLSEKYCKSIDFGYTLGYHEAAFNESTYLTRDDVPFLVLSNPSHNCTLSTKKSLKQGDRLGLYKHVINGEKCSSYKEGWIKKRDPDATMFSILGFIGTGALIGLFIEVRRLLIAMKLD